MLIVVKIAKLKTKRKTTKWLRCSLLVVAAAGRAPVYSTFPPLACWHARKQNTHYTLWIKGYIQLQKTFNYFSTHTHIHTTHNMNACELVLWSLFELNFELIKLFVMVFVDDFVVDVLLCVCVVSARISSSRHCGGGGADCSTHTSHLLGISFCVVLCNLICLCGSLCLSLYLRVYVAFYITWCFTKTLS